MILLISLQAVDLLHPYLQELWDRYANQDSREQLWPWRGSGDLDRARLCDVLDGAPESADAQRACEALLETRAPGCINEVLARAGGVRGRPTSDHPSPIGLGRYWFQNVGFDVVEGGLTRLCPEATYHLRFDPADEEEPEERVAAPTSPSWPASGESVETLQFGGELDARCGVCAGPLHRMLDLHGPMTSMGITSRAQVTLTTCISCLGWSEDILQFQHDDVGLPRSFGHRGGLQAPQFPSAALDPSTVGLVETPPRWVRQDWGNLEGPHLHRVGGEPTWVQDVDYPGCAGCGGTMSFVMQLDSGLALQGGGELLWGSGGVAYFFWCDACVVSASQWQCT